MNKSQTAFPGIFKNVYGFSLIELIVVMVIVGILATGVVFMFADPTAKVKAAAFNLLGEFNRARSEAVSRNGNVLFDFLFDVSEECQGDISKCTDSGKFDGYIICEDVNDSDVCDPADTIIKITLLHEDVQFYDIDASDGPDTKPDTKPCDGDDKPLLMTDSPDADEDNDGVTFKGSDGLYYDSMYFTPMGTTIVDDTSPPVTLVDIIDESPAPDLQQSFGYVILYYAASAKHHDKSYSVMFSSNIGSIMNLRWRNNCWDRR